jgi:hypothetical protein
MDRCVICDTPHAVPLERGSQWWQCTEPEHVCCTVCEYFNCEVQCPRCVPRRSTVVCLTYMVARRNVAVRGSWSRLVAWSDHYYARGYADVLRELSGWRLLSRHRSAAFRFQLQNGVRRWMQRQQRRRLLLLRRCNLPSELVQWVWSFVQNHASGVH